MCVCVVHVGGREEKEGTENIQSLPLGGAGVSSHAIGKQLCYWGALLAIHNVLCWWIKVEEAKYLAQIYAGSLTLRTNHPWAKSPFPVTSAENRGQRERESDRRKALGRNGGGEGSWEEGRRESEHRLRATLCIAERERKTHGRELGREGGCLCIAANCTGSPTLCCSHGSTPPPFKTFTGETEREREQGIRDNSS